jgi:hypothetical protein
MSFKLLMWLINEMSVDRKSVNKMSVYKTSNEKML